jgi:hypothetical protein
MSSVCSTRWLLLANFLGLAAICWLFPCSCGLFAGSFPKSQSAKKPGYFLAYSLGLAVDKPAISGLIFLVLKLIS